MTIIGLKELRQNTSEIAERASKGERFTVVKRSKPVFDIVPSSQQNPKVSATKKWTKELVDKHRPAFEELADK